MGWGSRPKNGALCSYVTFEWTGEHIPSCFYLPFLFFSLVPGVSSAACHGAVGHSLVMAFLNVSTSLTRHFSVLSLFNRVCIFGTAGVAGGRGGIMGHREGEAYEPRRTEGYPYICSFRRQHRLSLHFLSIIFGPGAVVHAQVRHRRLHFVIEEGIFFWFKHSHQNKTQE